MPRCCSPPSRTWKVETSASLPAELIYYPAPEVGQSLFGASTNGLASGNSPLEASIQASVWRLIEREHLVV